MNRILSFKFTAVVCGSAFLLLLAFQAQAANTASTFLGSLTTGENKAALESYIDEPQGFDIAQNGKIVIADTSNHDIKVINAKNGKMKTLAGSHRPGYTDAKAKKAEFNAPKDVAVKGKKGNVVFVADSGNHVIRRIKKNGTVETFGEGFSSPSSLFVDGNTLFVADTGNNRIVGVDTTTREQVVFASGDELNGVHEVIYWKKHRNLIFANADGEVRSVNVDTGKISKPIVDNQEDIGGITRDGRDLYVVTSTDIGVFNQIYRLRLKKPSASKVVRVASVYRTNAQFGAADSDGEACEVSEAEDCTEVRETDSMNSGSDTEVEYDEVTWEEAYDWIVDEADENDACADDNENGICDDQEEEFDGVSFIGLDSRGMMSLVESSSDRIAENPDDATCLPFGTVGENEDDWNTTQYVDIDESTDWQSAEFELSSDYQGDLPFFRVALEYAGDDATDDSVGEVTDGLKIAAYEGEISNLTVETEPRSISLDWDGPGDANRYFVQLWSGDELIKRYGSYDESEAVIDDYRVISNTEYSVRVSACDSSDCSEYSEPLTFRTPPGTVSEIDNINPQKGTNMRRLDNGNFAATLRFELRSESTHGREDLRAQVQLCSEDLDHPTTTTVKRLYVLYRGGGSIIHWNADTLGNSTHFAGEERFLDRFGKKKKARPGRPKDIEFSANGKKMFISQNNKIGVYNFKTKKYTQLAGHVMDSYTDGYGEVVRMSDPAGIALSPNGKWLYVADRNNHRIRKINTNTGRSKYVTGAGPKNYSFQTTDTAYQEGKACENEFDLDNSKCAYFNRPTGLAVTDNGKFIYVADASNNRIRRVNTKNGKTQLIAGSGTAGFTDGVGNAASFNGPYSVALNDDDTKLYVADKYNHAIRVIDLSSNTVSTLVGDGRIGLRDGAFGDAVLAIPEYVEYYAGSVYWTEAGSHTVRQAELGSGQVRTIGGSGGAGFENGESSISEFNNPKGLGFKNGKVFVADYRNDLIRRINLD